MDFRSLNEWNRGTGLVVDGLDTDTMMMKRYGLMSEAERSKRFAFSLVAGSAHSGFPG